MGVTDTADLGTRVGGTSGSNTTLAIVVTRRRLSSRAVDVGSVRANRRRAITRS